MSDRQTRTIGDTLIIETTDEERGVIWVNLTVKIMDDGRVTLARSTGRDSATHSSKEFALSVEEAKFIAERLDFMNDGEVGLR